jgi:hypothetical protein
VMCCLNYINLSTLPRGQDSTTSRLERPPSRLDNSPIRGKSRIFLRRQGCSVYGQQWRWFDDSPRLGRMLLSHLQKEDVITCSTGRANREIVRSHGILSRRQTESV